MLSTAKMREIDPGLRDLSEEDVAAIQRQLYESAQLAFEVYMTRKHGSNYPERLLTPKEEGGTL